MELGRPAERAPLPPIAVSEGVSATRPGGEEPGPAKTDGESENPELGDPGGSRGDPQGGAKPPPAPLPPPAGDDGDDDSEDDGDGDTDD